MEYDGDKPKKVSSIVVSTQHTEDIANSEIRKQVIEIIERAVPSKYFQNQMKFLLILQVDLLLEDLMEIQV